MLLLIWLAAAAPAWPAESPSLAEQARDVLARRCVACHSAQVKTSGLDLSSPAAAAKGGSKGSGLIVARVSRGEMPPAKRLPDTEIDLLRRWEAAGMPGWTGGAIEQRRADLDWWSFQPLRESKLPAAGEGNPVDGWIREKLRDRGWQMAPEADRRTLIRRVSFGLTGLPPTPEEIEFFLNDQRADAYERLVDRLLASPRYGEHWARHWLDVVRYAESEGFERDWLRDHAWPYRDYVIRSFNDDKPYTQFAREQIAGDVIGPHTRDGVVATSMLVLGPYDAVGLTSAVGLERDQVRADQMEEMVGLVAQTFLGLTVNCARCHDHKFDPIPQRDYYRMKAVFDAVWQPTIGEELRAGGKPVLTPDEAERHRERVNAIQDRIRGLEARLGALDRGARGPLALPAVPRPVAWWTLDTDARDETGQLDAGVLPDQGLFAGGRLTPATGKDAVTAVTAPLPFDLSEKTIEAWVHVAKKPEKAATLVRIRNRSGFRGAASDGIHYAGGKKRQWENTSTVRFRTEEVDGPEEDTPAGGRIHMAITYATEGEIRLYRNGKLYGRAYRPDPETSHGKLQTYGKGDAIVELSSANGLELEQARIFAHTLAGEQIAALFEGGVRNSEPAAGAEREGLVQALADARKELRTLTAEPANAFSAETRQAPPTRLLIRGDVAKPGDVVTPGGISCIKGVSGDLDLPADAPEAERRRRLADWIASPSNPLFARVIVNRIWHYHFGSGLVESPNDFGYNGGQPSHPELLDWLAADFIRHGSSIKRLQKLILTTAAYRQSSRYDSTAAAQDSGARFLWRFPPQRLPAEAVRDAMLAISGAMNAAMYGPSFRPFQIVKNAGSYHSYDPVDSADAALQRRTIYRMNINSGGNPMMDALDCPLPSMKTPKRSVTTTPLQALSLMNNPFADRMAKTLAARVAAERSGMPGRVARAFELALGRPPREDEAVSGAALAESSGLESLCWALFNMSEFLYVH